MVDFELGLTRKMLAGKMNYTRQDISKMRKDMSLDSICKIENEGTEIIKNMDENGQQSRDMAKEKIDVKVSEPVAICDQLPVAEEQQPSSQEDVARLIMDIRGMQVMIDRDLAVLYGVETKRLNEQVRRNIERFPERFRFTLMRDITATELIERTQD